MPPEENAPSERMRASRPETGSFSARFAIPCYSRRRGIGEEDQHSQMPKKGFLSPYLCCKCLLLLYNRNMSNANHISAMNELSASEGVFTAAQAARLGITRNALSQAVASGRADRIFHGAYKLSGIPGHYTDELAALWKLTSPAAFTHERMRAGAWDGIAVGGSTAASLLGIGDFYLSPYRIYAPKRINSRIAAVSFATRAIDPHDVTWLEGLPVTRMERTLVDLCLDHEDPSLIANAFADAMSRGASPDRVRDIAESQPRRKSVRNALSPINSLLASAEEGKRHEV